eukprot:8592-Heterococcus_DN1.PRE.2
MSTGSACARALLMQGLRVHKHFAAQQQGAGAALKMLLQLTGGASGSPRGPGALWGRLACEILTANPEGALHLIREVKQVIEFRGSSALEQLQQRSWLLHWSLFVFFHHANGRDELITLFFEEKFLQHVPLSCVKSCAHAVVAQKPSSQHLLTATLSRAQAIQTNCPWLLRYLVTAIILTKTSSNRRQNIMADLIKVLEQEQGNYSDPITDFLECLYVHFDFDGAMARCKECEQDYCCSCSTATLCYANSYATLTAAAMSSAVIPCKQPHLQHYSATTTVTTASCYQHCYYLFITTATVATAIANLCTGAAQRLLPVQCV